MRYSVGPTKYATSSSEANASYLKKEKEIKVRNLKLYTKEYGNSSLKENVENVIWSFSGKNSFLWSKILSIHLSDPIN